jgi:transcriptional regulator with XRE-family HTH domain
MRKARQGMPLTQAELARMLREKFGLKLERQAIIEIEKGTRRVSLDEAVVICAALDIALVNAITPWEDEDDADSGSHGSTWLKVGEGADDAKTWSVLPPELARFWICGERHIEPEPEQMVRFYYSNVPPRRRRSLATALRRAGERVASDESIPALPPGLRLLLGMFVAGREVLEPEEDS